MRREGSGSALAPGVAVILVNLVLLVPGALLGGAAPLPGATYPPPAPTSLDLPPSVTTWTLSGTVVLAHSGLGGVGSDLPVPGVTVVVASMDPAGSTCGGSFPTAATCSIVAQTVTGMSAGTFAFTLAAGRYWLYSRPSNVTLPTGPTVAVGGDSSYVDLTSDQTRSLVVYRFLGYGNLSVVLPAWNNLSTYLDNANGNTQVPIVAYTQDGVFYVNATGRWVFYSFPNRTVQDIGAWTPLYGNIANYAGDLENAGFLTLDGSYLYEIGCSTSCTGTSSVEVSALNTTTHRVFQHTYSGLTDGALATNGGVNLIGERGNSSIVVVFDAGGGAHAWNLWNNTEWSLGTLPFYEANNIYWVPELDSFLDIEAGGSTGDQLVQLRLDGIAPGTRLTSVATVTTGSGVTSNYVNGVELNLSSSEIAFSYGYLRGFTGVTAVYSLHDGLLGSQVRSYQGAPTQVWPNNSALQDPFADEHRLGVTTGAPAFQGFANGLFFNNSLLVDPFTGAFYDTNVTEPNFNAFGAFNQSIPAGNGPAPSNLFYNGSYFLTGFSVNCALRTSNDLCPLRGTTPGTAAGTVYWAWQLGLPEFPFRPTASLAETSGPYPPNVSATLSPAGVLSANWSVPDSERVVNWTVWLGASSVGPATAYNLPAAARTITWRALPSGGMYRVTVLGWNLHGPGRATATVAGTATATPYPVAFVSVGLPSPPPIWYLVFNGTAYAVPNGTLAFAAENGTYPYSIRDPAGYRTSPLSGFVHVNGSEAVVLVRFAPVEYAVSFELSCDLFMVAAPGAWSVVVNGVESTTTDSSIVLDEPNGSYSYFVQPPSGFVSTPASGAFNVTPQGFTVCLNFFPAVYLVSFVESGLAPGTLWRVFSQGTLLSSTLPFIQENSSNGLLDYSVFPVGGYTLAPSGSFATVNGSPLTIWANYTKNATSQPTPQPKGNASGASGASFGEVFGIAGLSLVGGGGVGYGITQWRRTRDRRRSDDSEPMGSDSEPPSPE